MDEFMRAALDEAIRGAAEGGIPIGAVLVDDDKIVAVGHNRRIQDSAPVMHGEINCLNNAGKTIDSFNGMTIYSTLMPCHMCAGAIIQFGITKVYAGESETFDEGRELMERHGIEVIDMDLDEAKKLMRDFIEANPSQWNQDIGKE
ncbi:MAG: nucleoside deaminase [Chloroflexi bacterium]|nr:nucleoside deaminase [Chloroflexota bacterium]MDA1226649.1 nucleoside deaminase [Chloroflexota bacterium]